MTGRHPIAAVVLAWIFPGLGHWYLGRRRLAVAFAAIVTAMFVLGLSFHGRLWLPVAGQPMSYVWSFADFGAGALQLAGRALVDRPEGDLLAVTHEYGTVYLATAGLMNLLLMLEVWDIATGRKSKEKEPA
ncbi:MAG TPA: DUF6677 family protein [Thermoanaerobaculia bacterium]|jgi:hypothetical protein